MAALSIRDLDDDVREQLRLRAARHGRSMEAEVRAILTAAVATPETETRVPNLATALSARFAALGGVELAQPSRQVPPRAAEFLP